MIQHIERVYQRVDQLDYREGMRAYPSYRATLSRLADRYEVPLPRVVASFAALSPNNDYVGNLRSTVTLLEGFTSGWSLDKINVSTYRACATRAWAFLSGNIEFLETTKGKKTRAFYQNILDPADPEPVTIDGHMLGLWFGQRLTMKEAVRKRIKYDDVAADFRAYASDVKILPNQLQAMLWFTWKRINHVIFRPQLSLFRTHDQWGLDLQPEEIRPFPARHSL